MIRIKDRFIGGNNPTFIIAEAGVNHNRDVKLAKQMVDVAKESGSDTVKFHAYKTDEIYIPQAELPEYVKRNMGSKKSYFDMAESLRLDDRELFELKRYCDANGILFSCTPYGDYGIKLMNYMNCEFFKVSSTHLTCTPFLKKLARTQKPIIISTGMSTIEDVKSAIKSIEEEGNNKIIIPHCTTNYPCPFNEVNLNVLYQYKSLFNYPIGYSDHTEGITVPVIASIMGASIIEKHFTLDRNMRGPDHKASLEPNELKNMVSSIRYFEKNKPQNLLLALTELKERFNPKELEKVSDLQTFLLKILGKQIKEPSDSEKKIMSKARTSIVSSIDINENVVINENMLKYTRPGTGIPPKDYLNVIGKKATTFIPKNNLLELTEQGIGYKK
ncbi:N-acetylneuraminate synthase family protein [Nanoarchaeota archaeon]